MRSCLQFNRLLAPEILNTIPDVNEVYWCRSTLHVEARLEHLTQVSILPSKRLAMTLGLLVAFTGEEFD